MSNQYELFLTKLFNISEEELKKLVYEDKDGQQVLKENAGDILIQKAADVEKARKEKEARYFEDGHKKGTSEMDKKARKLFKELLSFDNDAEKLEDFFAEFNNHYNSRLEEAKGKGKGQLTDDDVKKHPLFIDIEKKMLKIPEELKQQFEEEKKGIISKYERDRNIAKIKEKAKNLLLKSGAVLPKDTNIANNQIELFLRTLDEYSYDLSNEDDPIILKGDKRIEDSLGHPVKFDALVDSTIKSYFEIQKQDPKGGPGNEGSGGGQSGEFSFKDYDDYKEQVNKELDRAKRVAMTDAAKKLWPNKVA